MSQTNGNGAASQPRCCGQCRHWVEQPRPRDATGAVDMSQQRTGQCREGPPHLTIALTPRGPIHLCDYPPLEEGYPACSRFVARVGLKVAEG